MTLYKKFLLFFRSKKDEKDEEVKKYVAQCHRNVREYYGNNPGAEDEYVDARDYFSSLRKYQK